MPLLFALTLFLSASLLFVIQPLMGKKLLPLLGGTPAVWNTCLVFFQMVLLAGYLYADRIRPFPRIHLIILVLGFCAIFLGVPLVPPASMVPDDSNWPVLSVLAMLAVSVGLPFFVLSATAPLLQSWFAHSGHRSASNPYWLYAASNIGSMLGLFGYPLIIEPLLTLREQRLGWIAGFATGIALIGLCALMSRRGGTPSTVTDESSEETLQTELPPSGSRRLRWTLLAALPSALLMTSTTSLTTDVAPVPLLWVVPLGLYLLSFVIVFAWWPDRVRRIMGRLTPMALCFLCVVLQTRATEPILIVALIHLVTLFMVSLLCHGELAADRPHAIHLTRFYLHMSLGGVLGGLFVSLVAPLLFSRLGNLEYPLLVALTGLVRPRFDTSESWTLKKSDFLYPIGLACITVILVAITPMVMTEAASDDPAGQLVNRVVKTGLTAGIPAAIAFALVWRPFRFMLCLSAVLSAGFLAEWTSGNQLLVCRNYFGTLRVTRAVVTGPDGPHTFIRLTHGTTQHGQQRIDGDGPPLPTMYYHPHGPIGKLLTAMPPASLKRVGVVGLGCGAMAAYAKTGQEWSFFEIDPNVVAIAEDPRYFTFLSRAESKPQIVLGDARRQLLQQPDGHFDLIVLDAFSSDSVPVHLLTEEAFALYIRKLAPDGMMAFHVSNRYLDLAPLVARQLANHDRSLLIRAEHDMGMTDRERSEGKFASVWVIASKSQEKMGKLPNSIMPLTPTPGPIWRDDFSHLLGIWKRNEE